jgi:predicted amidohydrolase
LGEALLELGSEEKNALASLDMEKILGIRSELPFLQDADEFDIRSD